MDVVDLVVVEVIFVVALGVFFISLLIFCVFYVFKDSNFPRRGTVSQINGGRNPIASAPPNCVSAETLTRRRYNRNSSSETSSEGSDERCQRSNAHRLSCTQPVIMNPPPPSYEQSMLEDRNRMQSNANLYQSYQNSNFKSNLRYWKQISEPRAPFLWNVRRNTGPPPPYSVTNQTYTSNGQSSSDSGVTQTSPRSLPRTSRLRSDDSDELPPPYSPTNQSSSSMELAVNLSRSTQKDANEESDEYYSTVGGSSLSSNGRNSPNQVDKSLSSNLPANDGLQGTHESADDEQSDEDPVDKQRKEMFIQNWMEGKLILRSRRVVIQDQDKGVQISEPLHQQSETSTQSSSEPREAETSDAQEKDGQK